MEREYMADVEFQRLYDTEFQQDRTGVDSMFEEIYEASGPLAVGRRTRAGRRRWRTGGCSSSPPSSAGSAPFHKNTNLQRECQYFPFHKSITINVSGFSGCTFSQLAEGAASHVVTDTDFATLKLLLRYLYTGTFREGSAELRAEVRLLMHAADFYVVGGLKRRCEGWLLLRLDAANMVDLLVLGDTYHAGRLRSVAKEMLVENSN